MPAWPPTAKRSIKAVFRPSGCGVDGCAQARRAGPVNGDVVFRARRIAKPAELFGDLAHGRVLHARAVREDANRQPRIVDALQPQFGARLLIVPELDPIEGNVAALKEIADGIGLRRFTLAVEPYDRIVHDKGSEPGCTPGSHAQLSRACCIIGLWVDPGPSGT